MSKRLTGVILILVSALLLIGRYIAAAITANNAGVALPGAFETALEMSIPLLVASIVCAIAGVIYLIMAQRSKER